jgi:D-amino-acid dehydrogenase
MRVIVLGAGVIGTTCAYYLAKAGHEVTVVERRDGPALETSFANAGGICPGFAGPWAAPGMPEKVARWLVTSNAPVALRPRFDLHQWRWLLKFFENCRPERFARNKARMQRIAHYSKACLTELRAETGIAFDHGSGGVLQLFRTADELAGADKATRVLAEFSVPHRLLDREGVLEVEPALHGATVPFTGGLHLPGDETGDCHKFTLALADLLRRRGVTFKFETRVIGMLTEGGRAIAVVTDAGALSADAYVVALGSAAAPLLRRVGIDLPIYPVKGYSVTIELEPGTPAPRSAVMDEHHKVMITRMGSRMRAAGVAEISGYDLGIRADGPAIVRASLRDLFPRITPTEKPWAGLRPMTPDGPPYLGATAIANLYLDVGHGSNGWTQACGCGRILADVISGRQPEIDTEGFAVGR